MKNILKGHVNHKIIISFMFIMLFTVTAIISAGCTPKTDVKIYYASYEDNTSYLVPEIKKIVKDENFYKTVIEELIKGPSTEQLYPTLPSDTKVYSVIVNEGLATVDFSKEIITNNSEIPHSSTTESLAIFSIVDTLTEFEEIQKVRITVEGKRTGEIDNLYVEDFWGHIGIYDDFERDEQILTKNITE